MRLPRFDYSRPATLEEGLRILQEPAGPVQILAGGTDLLVNMKFGLLQPNRLVSIRSLHELSMVSEDGRGNIRIGACALLSDLGKNSLIADKLPALRDAVLSVASQHIRNMATIGGNMCLNTRCWYYNQS